ncbi:MAG: DUF721 domain-containing protein, partial [Bacteroidota bacterium]
SRVPQSLVSVISCIDCKITNSIPSEIFLSGFRQLPVFAELRPMRPTNENPIGDVIRKMMDKYELTEGVLNERINLLWHETVNDAISRRTVYIRFSQGILHITMNSSVISHELSMMRDELLNELNGKLESPVIREIQIQ